MEAPAVLKHLLYPDRDGLCRLRFYEDGWLSALVPDQERFGLARELVLQRIYDRAGGVGGDLVVDAGANVGFFSLLASRHAKRVVALEPDPVNFRLLELNLYMNRIQNVTPLNAALWTEDGPVRFGRPEWEQGRFVASTGSHIRNDTVRSGVDENTVEAVSLDTLVARYGDIDLLKMDIEGAEEQVLLTTSALPSVGRIVAELHLSRPNQDQPMLDALRGPGFDAHVLPSKRLYTADWVPKVMQNWRRLDGQLLIKLGLVSYLLAPITKPRRPGADMPLLVAGRR